MPSRRTFELVVVTVILMAPAMATVRLWFRKHLVVSGEGVTADLARVGVQIL